MKESGAYSSLREQGEMIGFQYATGEESEPKSMETESYATGVKRKKVAPKKRTILSDYRKKVAAKKPLVKSAINKKSTSTITQSQKSSPSVSLSMGAKIGIGVVVLAVLGGIVYVIKKKKK